MNRSTKVAIAAALASHIGLAAFLPAHAATVTGTTEGLEISEEAMCSDVDLTLVVQKMSSNDVIEGTTFTLERLAEIDLTTIEGWDAVRDLDLDSAREADKSDKWSAVSNASGEAVFTDLPVGAYLVTAEVEDDGQQRKPADFVMTLPTGGESVWNCSPEVYAKYEPVPETNPPTRPPFPPFEPPTTESTPPPSTGEDGPGGSDDTSEGSGITGGSLAQTGAAVISIVIAGIVLVLLGLPLLRRKRVEE